MLNGGCFRGYVPCGIVRDWPSLTLRVLIWGARDDGFEDFAAGGGEAREEFFGVAVAVAGVAPGGAVAVDDGAAFAGVGAGGGAVGDGVDEEEGIAFF